MSCFAPGDQDGTYNGNPLMCAVGLAVLDELLKPGFLDDVQARGQYLRARLSTLASRHGLGSVRARGLLPALDSLHKDATWIAVTAFEHGLLANAPRANTLHFVPALTVSKQEIDEMLRILEPVPRPDS